MPVANMLKASRLTIEYLRDALGDNEYKNAVQNYLPSGFDWPVVIERGKITQTVMSAVWHRQKSLFDKLYAYVADMYYRGDPRRKNLPASLSHLFDPDLGTAFDDLGKFVSTYEWRGAVLVTDEE